MILHLSVMAEEGQKPSHPIENMSRQEFLNFSWNLWRQTPSLTVPLGHCSLPQTCVSEGLEGSSARHELTFAYGEHSYARLGVQPRVSRLKAGMLCHRPRGPRCPWLQAVSYVLACCKAIIHQAFCPAWSEPPNPSSRDVTLWRRHVC